MEKIKAGLIGCGRIGYTFDLDEKRQGVWTHAGAYDKSQKIDFVGVYDTYVVSIECAAKYEVKVFPSVKEMVDELDIISIAVPEQIHAKILTELLGHFKTAKRTPKVLWVEKPFTGNWESAREYIDAFAAYDCHIHINYQRRFCPGFDLIKDRGQPLHVNIIYVRGLYNTASHFVDFITGLYGCPQAVIPTKLNSDFVMDYGSMQVSFSMLEHYDVPNFLRYNICDTTFYYPTEVIKAPALQTYLEITPVIASGQYSEYMDLGEPHKHELLYDPMVNQAEMLAEAIKLGKYTKLNNGLLTLQILELVSNDKGKIGL